MKDRIKQVEIWQGGVEEAENEPQSVWRGQLEPGGSLEAKS